MVSIIVPVYNVEQYLPECLSSILCQTYKDIEIILVNDGSTDRSGELCRATVESDTRVSLIEQKNKGLSAARNAGLDRASGKSFATVGNTTRWMPSGADGSIT